MGSIAGEAVSTKLTKLLQSGLKVFTLDDLGIIWGQRTRSDTRQSARDYAAQGDLIRLKPGVYTIPNQNPNVHAVANKLLAPSYVTGLSVLTKEGLSFQYTNRVFSVARYHKSYEIDDKIFVYSQVKASVLYNPLGLDGAAKVAIAGKERAITDLIYLNKGHYPFESFERIDWDLLEACANIYNCIFVPKTVSQLKEQYA